jgi:hypothetical protein
MAKSRKSAASTSIGEQLAAAVAFDAPVAAPQVDHTLYVLGKRYRGRAGHYTALYDIWQGMLPASAATLAAHPAATVPAITNKTGNGMVPVKYFVARGWLVPQAAE